MLDFLRHTPWPLIPALIAAIITFVLDIYVWKNIDQKKAKQNDSFMVRNYLFRSPPPEILNETGFRLHRWSLVFTAIFIASVLLTMVFWKR
jgi:uncharacterized membrane protein